ncbi:MFS transporter [Brevundimonas subvibrioides]|uniref:General substrate transporter n=1 Tax=Brevundimonas subvibrioides (strain ATCC 15264 / DSM 4735 / LMG 14903 / NBRC 16000 / CB 81) TaxID=633149 RepID=D9QFT8_BRESC|nr:MFS transporter [Brevundimonas subvibrioides]ADL00652.1 general substrate transporter [Brevundimonas subvibrioides ATCC 15264]
MTDVPMTPARRLKNIVGGSAGNLVEWFDWFAYAAFTVYFAPVFFPAGEPTAQLLSTAAILAVGFLMRPVGAWVMGVYADRKGRKAGLTLSVSLMCAGSLLIACTPGYATIGLLAPALLLLARMMQGLSVGGEYGSSATYLSEMATAKHRGFWSSFQYVTLISGQLLALMLLIVLQRTLGEDALSDWAWRIPFFVGAALAVVVFWLRRGLDETRAFNDPATRAAPKSSALELILRHPKEALIVIGLTAGGTLAFYTYTTYLQKFLINTSGFTKAQATEISAAALFLFMLLQPAVGALSDRVGRKPVMITFGVLGVVCTVPIMSALAVTTDALTAFALSLSALVIVSGYTAINAVVKAELFPAHIRALGVALPYALANAVFGGTAEYVALWLKDRQVESLYFWYVTSMIGVSLITYVLMRDTRTKSLIVED